jgi:hypothetical protein
MALYRLYAKWSERQETPRECAGRLTHMLEDLASIHPAFEHWYSGAKQKGKASIPTTHLETDLGGSTGMFDKGRRSKDDGMPWPELGYQVGAWNGIDGPKGVTFSARPGHYSDCRNFPNSVELEFRPWQRDNEDLVNARVLKSVFAAVIAAWEPACGSLGTWEYLGRAFPAPQVWPDFTSGWMTYLSAPYARRITPPAAASVAPIGTGILMLATNDPFTADNPAHVAVANAVQACMEPLQSNPQNCD